MMKRCFGLAVALTAMLAWGGAQAQTLPPVKFALDWTWQSAHSKWTLAQDRGYFKAEGIDVTIDRGFGSGDTITKVAAGSYDLGFADSNLLIKFNAENPTNQMVCVFIVYDKTPNAVIFLKSTGITKPKDLEGRTVSATEGEGTYQLFPILARANDIDRSKINWKYVNASLRDTLVAQGQAEATLGFLTTTAFNMKGTGIPLDKIGWLQYPDYGVALYSSGIVGRKDWVAAHPEQVKAFLRATVHGMKDMINEPPAAMASLKKRDALLDEKLEIERNALIAQVALVTPHVREFGVSTVDKARFEKAGAQVAEAFGVKVVPKMEDTYTEAYLPPVADRMIAK